jgi:transcriptional regulator with XRE-family HTH domain
MNETPLRLAREMTGLSQRELAKRCGISFGTYKDWEYGKHAARPTYQQIKALANELDVSEGEIAEMLGQDCNLSI